jgi:NAD(P)-dependent dehydrogenase (short-subunit alcohol dehydrogenase family)
VAQAFEQAGIDGPVTDVVHSAGVTSLRKNVSETSAEEWRRHIEVNLTGTFLVAREAARRITRPGTITVISSRAGRRGGRGGAAYSACKAGIVRIVESMAAELGGEGVRVNAILPYGVNTPMASATFARMVREKGISEEEARRLDYSRIALGHYAEPVDIARVCVFLASELAGYVTGASLDVDGAAS